MIRQWHISDEQIAEWHKASDAWRKDGKAMLKRALDASYPGTKAEPKVLFRDLKRAAYDFQVEEGKLINPFQLKQHILTFMWETDAAPYKEFVLDQ